MIDILFLTTTIMKAAVFIIIGLYLLNQWMKLEKKYTSDIPFLFGVGILFLVPGTIIDSLVIANLLEFGFLLNIRYALDIICITLFLGSLLSVWIAEKIKLRYSIIITLISISTIIFLLSPTNIVYLDTLNSLVSLPAIIIVIITFLFTYFTKRLTNVHGLLISISAIIVLISQVARPFLKTILLTSFMTFGLAWLANLIAVVGWIICYFGFRLKPGYVSNT
ncbi:MAG: hypothetical protein EU549_03675 [Promethearchaeota archaeon]|nr:MAG: hypothetical protein EU549_03675 [Candidatus Lokiarchaeota archaeon]